MNLRQPFKRSWGIFRARTFLAKRLPCQFPRFFATATKSDEKKPDATVEQNKQPEVPKWYEMRGNFCASLCTMVPKLIENVKITRDLISITTTPEKLIPLCRFLKEHSSTQINFFHDMSAIDHIGDEKRFEVFYIILSENMNTYVYINLFVDEMTPVPTLTTVYPGANWLERECYDMFVYFSPDIKISDAFIVTMVSLDIQCVKIFL
eukprot:603382_1